MTVRVYGIPASQGSKSTNRYGAMFDSDPKLKPWRAAIALAFLAERKGSMITGPVELSIRFFLRRPQSVKTLFPAVKPALDKLTRAVCDGITTSGAWEDDSRVVKFTAEKLYASSPETVGAMITIRPR